MKLSVINLTLLAAHRRGYRVSPSGEVISSVGNVLKLATNKAGYKIFSCKYDGEVGKIHVARLQAYQKFGDRIFEDGLEVRHLDNNIGNNSWDNIGLGTHTDNMQDMPPERRMAKAVWAASHLRRFTAADILEMRRMREAGVILSEIGKKFGIGKGHACALTNGKFYKNVS